MLHKLLEIQLDQQLVQLSIHPSKLVVEDPIFHIVTLKLLSEIF
jgi:hypothetical protein